MSKQSKKERLSARAKKAWVTRRAKNQIKKCAKSRTNAAKKAWVTRRAKIVNSMCPIPLVSRRTVGALKAWVTRRANNKKKCKLTPVTPCWATLPIPTMPIKRSNAAKKAWVTRRAKTQIKSVEALLTLDL